MYGNDDYSISQKRANANRAFIEAAINTYENANKPKVTPRYNGSPYASMVLENTMRKEGVLNRYRSFVETVKSSLVVESIYNIFENCIDPSQKDYTNTSIMRAMVSQYVTENGYDNILDKMRTGSVTLSEIYNIIDSTSSKILESVDKNDPNTFTITPEMKDEFFKSLDYSDSKSISDEINNRVSTAMQDFVTANAKDHEDIQAALQQAQEKIDKAPEKDKEQLTESYTIQAKRKTSEIRNAPKNVFHAMVSTMCESVLKHQDTNNEFLVEGHLDIDKIVSRTSLMYTFMEMLNTSRLDTINEEYIENVIKDLKQ